MMTPFAQSLEGMEIAIPPANREPGPETDEYGWIRGFYIRRPLPPIPVPKVPPKSVPRRLVSLRLRDEDSKVIPQYFGGQVYDCSKPLPPEPLCTRSLGLEIVSVSNRPFGHPSSRKALQFMDTGLNVYFESKGEPSLPNSTQALDSSSACSHNGSQQLSSHRSITDINSMRTSSKTLRSGGDGRAPVISSKENSPAHTSHHRFSDTQAAQEYHDFASQLECHSHLADYRIYLFSGWSGSPEYEDPLLRDENRSRSTFHGTCRQVPFERPRDSHYIDDGPTSAFDCESDDDEGAEIVESIRGFFNPKRDAKMETEAKRPRYGEKAMSFFRKTKERFAQQREEEWGFWRMESKERKSLILGREHQ